MMSRTDRDALALSIEVARTENAGRAEQIDFMLADHQPWRRVAEFAAYCAQNHALNLKPWQAPPCAASLSDLDKPFGDQSAARESAELLQRLLRAGRSRYEPDPLRALERAERRSASRRKRLPR